MIVVNCESLDMSNGFSVRGEVERREGIYEYLAIYRDTSARCLDIECTIFKGQHGTTR